jgi:hypothetical protein
MGKRGNGEGSITRRKDGLYMARYTVQTVTGSKRKALYGKTRGEVSEKLTKVMANRTRVSSLRARIGHSESTRPLAQRHGPRARLRRLPSKIRAHGTQPHKAELGTGSSRTWLPTTCSTSTREN